MFVFKRICILFTCFVCVFGVRAQDGSKAIPLQDILKSIEKKHHVSINFIDSEILLMKIIPPQKSLSLKQKIDYLKKESNLSFENIDNKFINISSNKEDKTICGFVYSKEDNSPIENVNIQLENGTGTTTNQKGYFELKQEEPTDFMVSYIGYISKKISTLNFKNKNCLTVFLELDVLKLDNIIANTFLTSGISKTIEGTFEIKPKKLGILPGLIESDVLQAMQQIPGINSADESVASINVRGGTQDQNLFLWNGIKMYQTGHFFGLISAFNPNLAHIISISKNGTSPFYGESVSSVVDISSNPSNFEKNSFSAGINMINADIYSKFNIGKKGFLEFSARKSITDFVKSPTYKQYFDKAFQNTSITDFSNNQNLSYNSKDKFDFYDITAKYSRKIGQKSHLILDLITISDQLKVFQTTNIHGVTQSENNVLYQTNYGGGISWKRNWNPKNSSAINIYTSYYEIDAEKNKIQSNQTLIQENKVLDIGVKIENSHFVNSKLTFNNGYQYNEIGTTNIDDVNSPFFYRKNKEVLRTHALIIQGKFTDTISKIYWNAGLRLNYIEKFNKFLLEPRLKFNYGINKYLNLEFLGEFKSQNSLQVIDLQKDYFGIEKRRWILANNTTIPIQKSKQASISVSYKKKDWLFTLENFYKKVTGINSASQGFQNQLEFVKINGDYEVVGTEILVQKKINRFITWLSYTYNDNNYYFPNLEKPVFSNNFELDHVVTWAGIYEQDNLKIALGSKWYSGRPETTPSSTAINYTVPSNPTIDYNSPNNKHLSNFFQFNFSTTYKWKSSKEIQYKLGFSILNVFNQHNEINEYYRINSLNNSIEDVKTFSLGRTPNLSFRVNF
jgi:hypothetical protein